MNEDDAVETKEGFFTFPELLRREDERVRIGLLAQGPAGFKFDTLHLLWKLASSVYPTSANLRFLTR